MIMNVIHVCMIVFFVSYHQINVEIHSVFIMENLCACCILNFLNFENLSSIEIVD